jgi:hypothetical protein
MGHSEGNCPVVQTNVFGIYCLSQHEQTEHYNHFCTAHCCWCFRTKKSRRIITVGSSIRPFCLALAVLECRSIGAIQMVWVWSWLGKPLCSLSGHDAVDRRALQNGPHSSRLRIRCKNLGEAKGEAGRAKAHIQQHANKASSLERNDSYGKWEMHFTRRS